jgi:hypothetical protein
MGDKNGLIAEIYTRHHEYINIYIFLGRNYG